VVQIFAFFSSLSLSPDKGRLPQIKPVPFPSAFFPINYSLVIIEFEYVQAATLTLPVTKPAFPKIVSVASQKDGML
jgi:hypothetical protein